MARWDIAEWVGPTPNRNAGGMVEARGLVIHIMQGTYDGSIAWGKNPASSVSFHFATRGDGHIGQLVDTADTAWTQGNGNGHWISVENEGFSGNPLTPGQVEAVAQLYARGVQEYGWPLQATDDPNGRGLGWHGMGGQAWGGHFDCPGEPIKAQRGAILARAEEILNGGDMGAYERNTAWLVQNGVIELEDPATIPVDDTEGSDVQGQVPNKLAAKLNEILAAAKAAGTPTQEQVTAAVKAALLDPAVVKVLYDAAFAGSQRAERE